MNINIYLEYFYLVLFGIFYRKRSSIKITAMVMNRRRDLFKLMDQ